MDRKNLKLKICLISFILSLPFWLGVNALAENLESFWFWQEIIKSPQMLNAEISQGILEKKIKSLETERLRTERLQNLDIDARAVISVEIDSRGNEKILFERNPEESLVIASLTKLMTALVIFDLDETYDFSQIIKVSEEAVAQDGQSKYGDLIAREGLSVENLLNIMLIESSNDAAFALTEPIGEEGFVGLMNLYAKDLGLENTHFVNPSGLGPDYLGGEMNYSSASDLVKLAKYILKNYPQIFEITTNQSYKVLKPDGSIHHFIPQNTNELLGKVQNIIGGKTGWSPEAGGCLLLVLENPKRNSYFINVILGSNDRFGEMRKLIEAIFY